MTECCPRFVLNAVHSQWRTLSLGLLQSGLRRSYMDNRGGDGVVCE